MAEQAYYRWTKECSGLWGNQAKLLEEMDHEHARLKKLLAEAELDKAILREAVRETSSPVNLTAAVAYARDSRSREKV